MQGFLLKLILSLLANPQFEAALVKVLGKVFLPLIPVAAASAAKAVADLIPGVSVVAAEVGHVAENVRDDLNQIIPDLDTGIPLIDNIMDFWRPKN